MFCVYIQTLYTIREILHWDICTTNIPWWWTLRYFSCQISPSFPSPPVPGCWLCFCDSRTPCSSPSSALTDALDHPAKLVEKNSSGPLVWSKLTAVVMEHCVNTTIKHLVRGKTCHVTPKPRDTLQTMYTLSSMSTTDAILFILYRVTCLEKIKSACPSRIERTFYASPMSTFQVFRALTLVTVFISLRFSLWFGFVFIFFFSVCKPHVSRGWPLGGFWSVGAVWGD